MIAARPWISAVSIPWTAFVGVFLYYTALTLAVLGGADLSARMVALAYLLPVLFYLVLLTTRALRALAALQIDIGHTPQTLLR